MKDERCRLADQASRHPVESYLATGTSRNRRFRVLPFRPAMPGAHRGSARTSQLVVAGAIVLLAAVGVFLFFFLRDGGALPPPLGPEEPQVPEFSFVVKKATAFPLARKPRVRELGKAVEQIRGVLDRFYVAGFLDPGQWDEVRFAGALEQFAGPSAREARRDLSDLTLGKTATWLNLVTPEDGVLRMTLLYDRARNPVMAVVDARFEAVGDVAGEPQDVSIEHRGEYILRRVRGRWAIVGYQVRGKIAERSVAATGGSPSPAGTGAPSPEGTAP